MNAKKRGWNRKNKLKGLLRWVSFKKTIRTKADTLATPNMPALSMKLCGGSCHWHWPRISAAAPEVEEVNVTPPFFEKAKRGIELCLPPTRLGPERAKNDGR